MKRINDILYNGIDANTGENVNYQKVTTFADGTAMDDTKCDGIIYRKVGSEYFKRVTPGGYAPIEWFVGKDLTNGVNSLAAVEKINKAGLKVKLPEGVIPLQAATNTTSIINVNTLWIEGAGKDKTKVILETKHSDAYGSGTYAYFKGNQSVYFKDFELTTRSIEDGIFTEIADEYELISITDPNQLVFEVEGCRVKGAIICRYFVTDGNELIKFVKLLRIKNNEFHYSPHFASFGTCGCTTMEVEGNFIYELLGSIVTSSAGFKANRLVKWRNNYLENTIIPTYTQWYHCPVVVVCHTIFYENNVVKGLINKNKTVYTATNIGAETYALYATAENLHFYNNTILNVLGQKEIHQDNCVFKVKGSLNVYCEKNSFTLEKQALVDAGVLLSIDSAYSTIDKNKFIYCFFGLGNQERVNKDFVFKNNRVKVPYINYACWVPYNAFDISGNTIEVDYVAKVRGENKQTIVYSRAVADGTSKPELKSFVDFNHISVNAVEDATLPVHFLANEGGVVSIDSTTALRSLHSISNNEFAGEGIVFRLGVNPAKIFKFDNNRTGGKDVSLQIEEYSSTDGAVVPLANITHSYQTRKAKADLLISKPKIWGRSEVKLTDNALDKLFVMKTDLDDWLYNSLVSESNPILFEISASYINSKGVEEEAVYTFAQISGSAVRYWNKATNAAAAFDPRDDVNPGVIEFTPKDGSPKEAGFFVEKFTNRTSHFYFTGLANSREVTITVNVWNRSVTAASFYTPFLSPYKNNQLAQNLGLHKTPAFGLHQLGGGQKLEAVANPAAPTITAVGEKGTPAAAEEASLQITAAATADGNVTVTLDGVATTVGVLAADTAIAVADKIRATAFAGWTVGGTAGTDTVTFISDTTGPKADATYSEGTTGATGTMTITVQGKDDTRTLYEYFVVAEDRNGFKTLVSPKGAITDGNPTLSTVNYNTVSWAAVTGAIKYYVLKTNTGTLLGTTGGTSLNDKGQATSAFTAPTRNQTADTLIDGRLNANQLAVGNSAAGTTPGTVVKKIEVFDSAGNSLGFVPVYDVIN
jgi:hypothetical protein